MNDADMSLPFTGKFLIIVSFLICNFFLTSQVTDESPHAVVISVSLNVKPLSGLSVVCLSVTPPAFDNS